MNRSVPAEVLVRVIADRRDSSNAPFAIPAAAVLFMTTLTAAAAQVSFSIPFTTIPFTMQPMVVLMAGMALGPRLGMASQILYLIAGIAGLPVFAASATLPIGAARLLGPSGGFLLSYPLAAFLTGWLATRGFDRRYATSVVAMIAGLAVVYACGVTWLGVVSSPAAGRPAIGISAALAAGFYPFVVADLLKVVLGAAVVPGIWRMVGKA